MLIPNMLQIERVTDAAPERPLDKKSLYDLFKKGSLSLWSKSLKKYCKRIHFSQKELCIFSAFNHNF